MNEEFVEYSHVTNCCPSLENEQMEQKLVDHCCTLTYI